MMKRSKYEKETIINWNEGETIASMKQLMAGGGVALIGITLIPLLSGLFG